METVPEYCHTEAWERLQFQRATDEYPSCVTRTHSAKE